ncbi:MAG TPA: PAS domain-containing sensor histidine kinase [Candidatus Saccharimonadales bacterium]|nr:PAS domain-containing sensor histidine kinase [Candidatus Saccharimonadales bacterium]
MSKFLGIFGKDQPGSGAASKLANSLRDERLRSEIILNSIEDGVILIDSQQTIQLFNPGAATITGWPTAEAQGLSYKSVIKLVDEKGQPYSDEQDPLQRVFTEKKTIRDNNAVLLSRSKKQFPIFLSITPLLDQNQSVTGAVATFRDVTQERQEEKQRAEFISTASHEMRTPVAAIEGYLALALNDKVSTIDSRARDYLEKAHASTQHLGKLFQDLLTSAKAEDGRLSNHPVVVELGSYLEQLVNDLRFAAEKKGLAMDFVVGSTGMIDASRHAAGTKVVKPLYYVYADPDRMREVITNLFDNAVKYTDQGKVSIGLTGDEQVAQLYIKDTGPGIPAEDVPHLFQKFYRVDNSATRTIGGTGLGLFICRKIVELYQGRIWVESTLGKGSAFFINLPRLSTEKASALQAQEASKSELQPITSLASGVVQ